MTTAAIPVHRSHGKWITLPVCPKCGRAKNCRTSADGELVWCTEVDNGREKKGRGWIHPHPNAYQGIVPRPLPRPSKPVAPKAAKRSFLPFREWVAESQRRADQLHRWAERRAVTVESLQSIGAVPVENRLLIPEQLEPGQVDGVVKRFWDPIDHNGKLTRFLFSPGSRRGWTRASEWQESRLGVLGIAEGFSDVCSLSDGGFAAIGRYTRAAKLEQLKPLLKKWPSHQPIVVILENDEPKPGIDPEAEVRKSCLALSEAIRRPVLMSSPPSGVNDINDWWRALTEGRGHELGVRARHRIGRKMRDELLENAVEIDGCDEIRKANRKFAADQAEQVRTRVAMLIADRSSGGPDMDYDVTNSCAFHRGFTRENEQSWIVWGAKLGCSKWACSSCRRRLLIPAWQIRILEGLAGADRVFLVRLACDCQFELQRKIQKLTKQATAEKADWACVEMGRDEGEEEDYWTASFFSTWPPKGKVDCVFDLLEQEDDIAGLCEIIIRAAAAATPELSRPIRTSRSMARCEKPTFDDWLQKARRIAENRDAIYVGIVTADAAKQLRSACRETQECQYITRDMPSGDVWCMTSQAISGVQAAYSGSAADQQIRVGLRGGDETQMKSSGAWRAKPTKGNRPLDFNCGPSDIRTVAKELGRQAEDFEIEDSAIVDAAGIKTHRSDTQTQTLLLSRLMEVAGTD